MGPKSTRLEQFLNGAMTAMFLRPWILFVTYFVKHPTPEYLMETMTNKVKAQTMIKNNKLKFYFGLAFITISISKP